MKFIRHLFITCMFVLSPLHAAGEVLNVAIETFSPPFVMQSTNKQIYGYDVDMMNSLCKIMNRRCVFHVMRFDKLLDAVATKKVDVAVSSITITPARSQIVSFTMPYQLSYSRFLTNDPANTQKTFSLDLLNNATIGLETGTIFSEQIQQMGIKNPTLKYYDTVDKQLEALGNKDIKIILLDNATATYWAANSAGAFHVLGPAYVYGYGYGIAVNKMDNVLLTALNNALAQYQSTPEYKTTFDKYLAGF